MLRVGLTGGLGSGKSTVAAMLTAKGAWVLAADELGRELMQPGTAVYAAIVERFGRGVVKAGGGLDRAELARLAFGEGRVEELNAIVHPATIALQGERMGAIFAEDAGAVVVVETALLFETRHGDGWRGRFDRVVLVTAPEAVKIARFVARAGGGDREALEAEARRRLAMQMPDEAKVGKVDYVVRNDGSLDLLATQVDAVWRELMAANVRGSRSLS